MTIEEASFQIMGQLMQLAESEGRVPCIVGVHSIVRSGGGQVSVWLDLDDPNANEGNGIIWCHVDETAVTGLDHAAILEALTGYGGTIH